MPNFYLSTRIKMLRERERMSREDLAKKIGVSYSAIAMYERGEREPDNEKLLKIAETFNVTTDYLLGNKDISLKDELESRLKRLYLDEYEFKMAVKVFKNNYFYLNDNDDELFDFYNNRDNIENAYNVLDDIFSVYLVDDNGHFIKTYSDLSEKEQKEIFDIIDSLDFQKFLRFSDNKKNINNQLFNIPVLGKITAGQPILAEEYLEGYLPVDPNIYGMTTPDDYFYLLVSGESMNLKVHNGDYALIHKQDYAENGDIVVAIVNGFEEATLKRYKKINDEIIMLEPMSTYPMEPIVINLKDTKFKIIGKAIGQFGKF